MSNTPATQNPIVTALSSDAMKTQFAAVLPGAMTPDRFVRFALTATRKTPKLLQCSRESVLGAFMTCAELGIEPDGRRAHLIPYGTECQLIIDYKGLMELVMRSGLVSIVHADLVREFDHFEYGVNDNGLYLNFSPNIRGDRGEVIGAYAIAKMKDGSIKPEFMTVDDIDAIKNRSRAKNNGPWKTDLGEMQKKTVLRRLCKGLPLSPEFRDAVDNDFDKARDISGQVHVHESPASDMTKQLAAAVVEAGVESAEQAEPVPAEDVNQEEVEVQS